MAEIVNILYTGEGIESQNYSAKDNSLITNSLINTKFGDPNDTIEYFIYDTTGTLLDRIYNASNYIPSPSINPISGLYSSITLDPKNDLAANGYNRGTLNIQYNFLRNLFNSSYGRFYWIKEVSISRTELKLASQNLSNTEILDGFNQYQAYIAGLNYYPDFYLNFGDNQHIIATNVAYTEDEDGSYLLIKLYEPLPSNFDEKDSLWIVEKIADSANYNVDIQIESVVATQEFALRGPNYNVKRNEKVGETTPYYSYSSLTKTPISSSFQKMMSYYQDRAVAINVDYSDFSNFIHFSSATSRINNFVSKLSDIERYNAQISQQLSLAGSSTSTAISSSVINLRLSIDSIITNFDNYEYYLYYSSGSTTWPKSNSTQPYSLYSVTSSQAINWLGSEDTLPTSTGLSILYSSSFYDATNKDLLANVVPQFISDDLNNEPYITFVNMIGQHFDNIWIYYKDVTNRFDATNNPATGISPDIVADALINLGTTLYTNTNLSNNLYYSLFGINEDGSLLPPTGSEKISTYVTSSLTTLPEANIKKEIYKRIYHNIPYLYKTKGTRASIEAIVNIFGIPKSILSISEFGGYDRYTKDGIDEIFNTKVTGSTSVLEISASVLNPYTTLQYYNDDTRLNSKNLEFGFSPSDALNSTITSSLGYFNIDQLIGNPNDQYNNTYPALDQTRTGFFDNYNFYHNIYEYVRLLKYYDNSIFKMVQDYVPARSNLSTGLIVKSHILERNKYERYEPEVEITNNYSESIELLTVSGTDPNEIPWSTANTTFSQFTVYPLANNTGSDNNYIPVEINNNYSWEKYTGEFGGSTLDVTTGNFSQIEASSMTNPGPFPVPIAGCNNFVFTLPSGSAYTGSYTDCNSVIQQIDTGVLAANTAFNICSTNSTISIYDITLAIFLIPKTPIGLCTSNYELPTVFYNDGAIYNNITKAVTSTRFIDAEYSYGIDVPVNISNIVSESSCQNCNRINCYDLTVINPTVTVYAFTYQDCNNETQYVGLLPFEVSSFCAKSNTLNFLYDAESYLTVTQGGICGASFSNYPYVANCKYISITNTTTSSFDISYIDCEGVGRTAIVSGSTSSAPVCLDPGTLYIGSIFAPPISSSSYTISDFGFCNYPFPYTLSTEFTKYCDLFAQYTLPVPFIPGVWSYEYQRCSDGLIVSASGVTPLTEETVVINACVRSGTIVTSGVIIPEIITGSLSYCGFYEDPTPFTGSRTPVEIQEYNYNRTSALRSKYEGAKSISAKYNVFTKGDQSYPGYAAADNYVGYTGLFTNVESSSYYPDQMVVKLAYFSDTSGGLNDLNLENNNWVYMQNIYKPNSTVTIKQFNATQFSNQYYLDKQFKVVESGYSNQPYWYRSNVDTQECYRSDFPNSGSNQFAYININYASVPFGALNLNVNYPPTASTSPLVKGNLPYIPSGSSESDFSGSANTYQLSLFDRRQNIGGANLVQYYYEVPGSSPGNKYITGSYYNAPENGIYSIYSKFYYTIYSSTIPSSFDVKIELIKNPISSSGYIDGGTVLASGSLEFIGLDPFDEKQYRSIAEFTGYLNAGDRVFTKVTIDNWIRDYDAPNSVNIYPNEFYYRYELVSVLNSYCIPIEDYTLFNSSYQTGGNILPLTENMSRFFDTSGSTIFLPEITSSLYPLFGDVNYTTAIEPGDYIILYYNGSDIGLAGSGELYPISKRIIDIIDDGTQKSIQVYPDMLPYITAANINDYQKIVFIKKQPDESVVILQGKKRPGKTSYGFLVPQDINPYILQNINTLQSSIQSQILDY
jgi:hypothetical protein